VGSPRHKDGHRVVRCAEAHAEHSKPAAPQFALPIRSDAATSSAVSAFRFIQPCNPVTAERVPGGGIAGHDLCGESWKIASAPLAFHNDKGKWAMSK